MRRLFLGGKVFRMPGKRSFEDAWRNEPPPPPWRRRPDLPEFDSDSDSVSDPDSDNSAVELDEHVPDEEHLREDLEGSRAMLRPQQREMVDNIYDLDDGRRVRWLVSDIAGIPPEFYGPELTAVAELLEAAHIELDRAEVLLDNGALEEAEDVLRRATSRVIDLHRRARQEPNIISLGIAAQNRWEDSRSD